MQSLHKKIDELKKEKNAVILAHYYVPDEVQEAADYIGDSYYLAKIARDAKEQTIVFCGVEFMGESAKILNPEKTVLMPDMTADCPMAHMVSEEKIQNLRKEYDDLAVVCYINSTARLKTMSDVCVTSSNAVKIVRDLPNRNIFFIPDGNLGRYVSEQVPEKNVILNDGHCPIHNKLTANEVKTAKEKHPNALVLTHPECRQEVLDISDFIGSTSEIIEYSQTSDKTEFIICTEKGVGYELRKQSPQKQFHFASEDFICPDMKLNTLEKLCECLETGTNRVEVIEELREKSLKPLDRMLDMAK